MTGRRWPLLFVAIGLVAIGLVAIVMTFRSTEDTVEGRTSDAASTPVPRWAAGGAGRYTFSYRASQSLDLGSVADSARFEGMIDLEGTLVLAPLGGGRWVVAIEELTRHNARVAGDDLLPRPEILEDALITFETGEGGLRELAVAADAPPVVQQMSRQLALELALDLRSGHRWTSEEPTPFGRARSVYQRDGDELRRQRHQYVTLPTLPHDPAERSVAGELVARWTEDGPLSSLEGRERLSAPGFVAETELTLAYLEEADVPAIGSRRPIPLEPELSAETEAELLAQRVDGMTPSELTDVLARFGDAGRVPEHHTFLRRSTGLLLQQPEAAFGLRSLFVDEDATHRRRLLVLDLLAATPTPEARTVLAELLGSSQAQRDPHLGSYLQRLSLVPAPTPELERLARDAFDRRDTRHAASYALGGLARRLADAGDDERARTVSAPLRAAIPSASADTLPHLVIGLGNAGRSEDVPLLAGLANGRDDSVGEAVAYALGHIDGPESRAALMTLIDESSPSTQGHALRALRGKALEADQLLTMADGVRDGRIQGSVLTELERLLRDRARHQPEAVRTCASAILAQNPTDGQLRTRVRALIQQDTHG